MLILTETRWGFDSTWEDDQWSYIHSTSLEHKSGGILVMMSKKVARSDMLGYEPIVAGRLLHVRIHYEGRAVDLLAVCQYMAQPLFAARDKRQGLWAALDSTLTSLPKRNLLICAGDYNCTLPGLAPWTGSSHFRWNGIRCTGHAHADHMQFLEILQCRLVALTSWDESTGPTFIHGHYATRIDHILIRLVNCDGLSKAISTMPHADIVPLNQTHHIPIRCTVRFFQHGLSGSSATDFLLLSVAFEMPRSLVSGQRGLADFADGSASSRECPFARCSSGGSG